MRKHQKRWIALAGATTLSVAGLVAGSGPATAEYGPGDGPLAWPVVQQGASTYTLDGFEIAYLPPGLDRYGIHAKSTSGRGGERVSAISWVQGFDSVYGKVGVIRSEDITDLEDMRKARYSRLDDDALEKTEHHGVPAYLSKKSGELFWVPESGVGVEAYLKPDRWESDELVSLAEGVRKPQKGAESGEDPEPDEAGQGDQADPGGQESAAEEGGAQETEAEESQGPESEDEEAGGTQEGAEGSAEEAGGTQEGAEEEGPAEEGPAGSADGADEASGETGNAGEEAAEAPGSSEPQIQPAGSEGESSEGRQESEDPEEDAAQEESGSPQQPGDPEGAEPSPGAGEEGAEAGEQPAEEADSGTEAGETPDADAPEAEAPDAQEQEGAESADGSFVPGASLMDVRTCLAEELLTEDAQAQPAEVAGDTAALLELWRSVDTDARDEAAQACAERFEADRDLVDQVMADLAAEAEGAEGTEGSEGTEGADASEAQSDAERSEPEETVEDAAESSDSEDDPLGLWGAIPLSLPEISVRL